MRKWTLWSLGIDDGFALFWKRGMVGKSEGLNQVVGIEGKQHIDSTML